MVKNFNIRPIGCDIISVTPISNPRDFILFETEKQKLRRIRKQKLKKLNIMGKFNFITKIKMFLASIGWKIFIWGNNYTEEEYWESIYQQEKNHKINNA